MSKQPEDNTHEQRDSPYEIIDHLFAPEGGRNSLAAKSNGSKRTHAVHPRRGENIRQAWRCGVPLRSIYFSGEGVLPVELANEVGDKVAIFELARRTCKKLFDKERASRLFAVAEMPKAASLESLTTGNVAGKDIIVLDHLTIQGNIGAIIRNCVAFDIGAVVMLGAEQNSVFDRRIIRSSRGYVFALPIVPATTESFVRL